ncbi:CBS domain-containing protein [Nitrosospira briensis]|uniref:CBS domain-containing protein n=1 Tax=Nitrosospira briensis TaxID=35799 RepID=A0A1I5ATM1_9PROT|nr:CBS domain-containing protein [Nitrosospira briensis]SFN65793.1 CBS domain-containing protein [Nitrosospira briensis]SFN86512.1 CBS domain-containing protein [Nitrosospira briensis]
MTTVRQLLEGKGYEVASIDPDNSVYDAMQLMADRNIGALLVLQAGKLAGIFTERDYSRKAYLLDKSAKDIQVKEIMTAQVAYVNPDYTAEDCMALVTEMRVRHLPVLDNSEVVGIISIGDLVKDAISGKEFIIHQLERYIYGFR